MLTLLAHNYLPVIFALLCGITQKIADLLNEHGLRWFKGADIWLGIIWGTFGVLMAIDNNIISNIVLATCLASIIRNRADYLNHRIAISIIIITLLSCFVFLPTIFLAFYLSFLVFGSMRDYIGEKIESQSIWHKIYDNFMWYYPVPTLLYCLLYQNWVVFWAFLGYTLAYDLTKYLYKKRGYA